MARLFEPFASDKPGGLGLGLTISRRIAVRFGGELYAENHPEGRQVVLFIDTFSRYFEPENLAERCDVKNDRQRHESACN